MAIATDEELVDDDGDDDDDEGELTAPLDSIIEGVASTLGIDCCDVLSDVAMVETVVGKEYFREVMRAKNR